MDVVEFGLPGWLLTGAMLVALTSAIGVAVALHMNKGRVAMALIGVFVLALGIGLMNDLANPADESRSVQWHSGIGGDEGVTGPSPRQRRL